MRRRALRHALRHALRGRVARHTPHTEVEAGVPFARIAHSATRRTSLSCTRLRRSTHEWVQVWDRLGSRTCRGRGGWGWESAWLFERSLMGSALEPSVLTREGIGDTNVRNICEKKEKANEPTIKTQSNGRANLDPLRVRERKAFPVRVA